MESIHEETVLLNRLIGDLRTLSLAEAGRAEQALANLVENALRYGSSDAGGHVTLGARAVPDGVEAWVSDTGPGIALEDMPHVFERFWRAEKSRSLNGIFDNRKRGGSGIGLALVKQLVLAHGRRVDVESTPGHGATFRVILPIKE